MPRTILTFDENGTLLEIQPEINSMDALQGVEFYSGVIVPGLINCHSHIELSVLKGKIPENTGLTGFVKAIGAVRGEAGTEQIMAAASYQDSSMYSEGIIAVADICNSDVVFPVKKSGINYYNLAEVYGFGDNPEQIYIRGKSIKKKSEEYGMPSSVTPHSTYSVSDGLLNKIISEHHKNAPLSVHFLESQEEKELYRNKGALADRYREIEYNPDFLHYSSPVNRLIKSIPWDVPILLVHNTFVTGGEVDIIESHFSDVTWVVCPRSNKYIEGKLPDVELLLEKSCRIAIGTDSLASNYSLSMADEISFILDNFEIPFDKVIDFATVNGAKALKIDQWAGTFEVGKKPGAVLAENFECRSFRKII